MTSSDKRVACDEEFYDSDDEGAAEFYMSKQGKRVKQDDPDGRHSTPHKGKSCAPQLSQLRL